jgi:hypothetical protein
MSADEFPRPGRSTSPISNCQENMQIVLLGETED